MAAAVPVVATPVGGVIDAVTDGVTGILVPLDDPTSLAKVLRKLESNSVLRAGLGLAGRDAAHAKFSQEIVIEKLSLLYEMLAGRQSQPTPISAYVDA